MSLIGDIIEIRQILAQIALVLALLQYVLPLVPVPGLVDLTEVLNDQIVALDALFSLTENSKTFRMHPKVRFDLAREVFDCSKQNL